MCNNRYLMLTNLRNIISLFQWHHKLYPHLSFQRIRWLHPLLPLWRGYWLHPTFPFRRWPRWLRPAPFPRQLPGERRRQQAGRTGPRGGRPAHQSADLPDQSADQPADGAGADGTGRLFQLSAAAVWDGVFRGAALSAHQQQRSRRRTHRCIRGGHPRQIQVTQR
jgi:hypothetical protein